MRFHKDKCKKSPFQISTITHNVTYFRFYILHKSCDSKKFETGKPMADFFLIEQSPCRLVQCEAWGTDFHPQNT